MLVPCWAGVADAGPAWNQHCSTSSVRGFPEHHRGQLVLCCPAWRCGNNGDSVFFPAIATYVRQPHAPRQTSTGPVSCLGRRFCHNKHDKSHNYLADKAGQTASLPGRWKADFTGTRRRRLTDGMLTSRKSPMWED